LTGNLTWQRSWSPRSALTVRLGAFVAREWHDPYNGSATPGIELWTAVNPPSYQNTTFRTAAYPSSVGLTAAWTGRGRLVGLDHEVKLGAEYTVGGWYYERRRNAGMTWRPLRVAEAHWGRYHQRMFAALFDRVAGAGSYSDEEIWSSLGAAPGTPSQTFTRAERDSLAAAGLFRFEETVRLDQAGRVEQYHQPYM